VTQSRSLLRDRSRDQRVTNAELFFDLVYVFAVTQLSHRLVVHLTVENALQTALLLAMVWQAWVYMTWVTNWLDPARIPVRVLLLTTSFASLVMSSGLPHAFDSRAWVVAGAYVAMQIGRSVFVVIALGREGDAALSLRLNYERILAWSAVGAAFALAGAAADGHAREVLWLLAVAVELFGGAVGFHTPRLGRSTTEDWTIEGGHFAERCQAFVLIAVGESVVAIGGTLSEIEHVDFTEVLAFVAAFLGAIAFWWMYFDRSADAAAELIAGSDDPGALGRSAFHYVHPIMIAGIIASAAADDLILADPRDHPPLAVVWLTLGGTALFIAGHAIFKAVVWRVVPWPRIGAVCVLLALVPLGPSVPALAVGAIALAVLLIVLVLDHTTDQAPFHPHEDGVVGGLREEISGDSRDPDSSGGSSR
jgi:low temperature requirement protein LtrA